MPAHSWTTAAQWDWLCSLRTAAREARAKGRYSTWLASVYHDWFLQWPERKLLFGDLEKLAPEQQAELGKAISARRLQLASWFNNHKHKTRGTGRSQIPLPKGKGGKRVAQPRELWCRTHYTPEKKAVVESKLSARREELGRKLTRSETMTITRVAIDQFYEEESEDVKQELVRQVDEEKSIALAAAQPVLDNGEQRSPEQYQHAVDNAPLWIEQALAPVSDALGWCLTVVAAGPVPEEGGEIRSFAIHLGRNQSGHTFAQANPDFREQCVRPLVHFAKGVYPEEERDRRALRRVTTLGTPSLQLTDGKSAEAAAPDTPSPAAGSSSTLDSGSSVSSNSSPTLALSSVPNTSMPPGASMSPSASTPPSASAGGTLDTSAAAPSIAIPVSIGAIDPLALPTTGSTTNGGAAGLDLLTVAAPYPPFDNPEALPPVTGMQDLFGGNGGFLGYPSTGAQFGFNELGFGNQFPFLGGPAFSTPFTYPIGPWNGGVGSFAGNQSSDLMSGTAFSDLAPAPAVTPASLPSAMFSPDAPSAVVSVRTPSTPASPASRAAPSVPLVPGVSPTCGADTISGPTSALGVTPLTQLVTSPATAVSGAGTTLPVVDGGRPARKRRAPKRPDESPERSSDKAGSGKRTTKRRM